MLLKKPPTNKLKCNKKERLILISERESNKNCNLLISKFVLLLDEESLDFISIINERLSSFN